jgi:hypothetical protein
MKNDFDRLCELNPKKAAYWDPKTRQPIFNIDASQDERAKTFFLHRFKESHELHCRCGMVTTVEDKDYAGPIECKKCHAVYLPL